MTSSTLQSNLIVVPSDDAPRTAKATIELGTRSNLITLKAAAALREIYTFCVSRIFHSL